MSEFIYYVSGVLTIPSLLILAAFGYWLVKFDGVKKMLTYFRQCFCQHKALTYKSDEDLNFVSRQQYLIISPECCYCGKEFRLGLEREK